MPEPVWKERERYVGRLIEKATDAPYLLQRTAEAGGRSAGIDLRWAGLPLVGQVKTGKNVSYHRALQEVVAASAPGEHPFAYVYHRFGPGRSARESILTTPESFAEMIGLLTKFGVWR